MAIKTHTMTLIQAHMISPHVRHLAFSVENDAFAHYIAGQFITLHFEADGNTLRRSYSIASIPGKDKHISFAAGFVENGPGTRLLFNLSLGDQIQAAGPFGRLILRDEQPKRYIFAATSTGVTPFRAMLPALAERLTSENLEVYLLFGVQHRDDLIYADDFLAFTKQYPNFHFRAHYSREPELDLKDHEYRGYVQSAFETINPQPDSDIVYLCGNPEMIDNAFAYLTTRGFDIKNVRREKYLSK